MHFQTDDVRIAELRPLIPPAILMEELPLGDEASACVARIRDEVSGVVSGRDDRLLVVVGPCSIHDPAAGLDYAKRLRKPAAEFQQDLLVIMRVYFEKPRTIVGWKGLINDPYLDGSFVINEGLRRARRFLLGVTELGLGAGTEFLDPITPQFLADLVSWGAIGARTSESQVHRELASGLSMPVGFKNATDGNLHPGASRVRRGPSWSPRAGRRSSRRGPYNAGWTRCRGQRFPRAWLRAHPTRRPWRCRPPRA